MPLDHYEPAKVADALLEKVKAFAASQPNEVFVRLLGFFHLADPLSAADVDLTVDANGRVALYIAARPTGGETDGR